MMPCVSGIARTKENKKCYTISMEIGEPQTEIQKWPRRTSWALFLAYGILVLVAGGVLWLRFGTPKKVVEPVKTAVSAESPNETAEASEKAPEKLLAKSDFQLIIETDKLHISGDIIRGVTDDALGSGIGRHVTTGYPNKEGGNMVLSGHRWYPGDNPYSTIFADLNLLQTGDKIVVLYQGSRYHYEVTEQKVVAATDISILEPTAEPMITLYTCTPKYTSLERLVYRARLVEVTQ